MHDFTAPTLRARRIAIIIALVGGLLALAMRWYYVMHAQVLQPIDEPNVRADAVEYYRYAWNLVHHHSFASDIPGPAPAHPNSFRDPGYPVFLAGWLGATSGFASWYGLVLLSQAFLGSLAVCLTLLAVRNRLPNPALGVVAVMMAVWPHSVTMTSFVLSETLVGFLVACSLLALRETADHPSIRRALIAGLVLSLGAMTNAVLLPFGLLISAIFRLVRLLTSRQACVLAVATLLLPAAWGVRAMTLAGTGTSTGRAAINLVQGSWPNYHSDYQLSERGDKDAVLAMKQIDDEIATFGKGPAAGLHRMADRMGTTPLVYIRWYASKPLLLWGWDIKIGQGDVYVYPTIGSPFNTSPSWKAILAACYMLNPFLLLFALIGAVIAFWQPRRDAAMVAVATLTLMITVVYGVLQSEPRYAIPFRGSEMVLAGLAVSASWAAYRQRATLRDTGHTSTPS